VCLGVVVVVIIHGCGWGESANFRSNHLFVLQKPVREGVTLSLNSLSLCSLELLDGLLRARQELGATGLVPRHLRLLLRDRLVVVESDLSFVVANMRIFRVSADL